MTMYGVEMFENKTGQWRFMPNSLFKNIEKTKKYALTERRFQRRRVRVCRYEVSKAEELAVV